MEELPEIRFCLRSSSATRAVSRATVASSWAMICRWASIVAICRTTSAASSSYDGRRSGSSAPKDHPTARAVVTPSRSCACECVPHNCPRHGVTSQTVIKSAKQPRSTCGVFSPVVSTYSRPVPCRLPSLLRPEFNAGGDANGYLAALNRPSRQLRTLVRLLDDRCASLARTIDAEAPPTGLPASAWRSSSRPPADLASERFVIGVPGVGVLACGHERGEQELGRCRVLGNPGRRRCCARPRPRTPAVSRPRHPIPPVSDRPSRSSSRLSGRL